MAQSDISNVIQSTVNYDQFSFLEENRDINRPLVEAIKKSFEERGNFTKSTPILVNGDLQIIDGQHRFTACVELGEPIYFTIVEGLGVPEARAMNILQKSWEISDYAKSYATEGMKPYVAYQRIRSEYPQFSHSIILAYIVGGTPTGTYKKFRLGELEMFDTDEVRARLDKLSELAEICEAFSTRVVALALLSVMKVDGYSHKRMVEQVTRQATDIRPFHGRSNNIRMLENVYNHNYGEKNRLRFF